MRFDPYATPFVPIFDALREYPGLKFTHHLMYGTLETFNGTCNQSADPAPTIASIIERSTVDWDEVTATRLIKDLEKAGLVKVERARNARGRATGPAKYTLLGPTTKSGEAKP